MTAHEAQGRGLGGGRESLDVGDAGVRAHRRQPSQSDICEGWMICGLLFESGEECVYA